MVPPDAAQALGPPPALDRGREYRIRVMSAEGKQIAAALDADLDEALRSALRSLRYAERRRHGALPGRDALDLGPERGVVRPASGHPRRTAMEFAGNPVLPRSRTIRRPRCR